MKRLHLLWLGVSGMLALAACSREYEDPIRESLPDQPSFRMEVNADGDATKTVVADDGNGGYAVSWQAGDRLGVFEVANGVVQAKSVSDPLASGGSPASFMFSLDGEPVEPFNYTFVYPATALSYANSQYRVTLPASQTFSASSYDPAADVLVSEHISSDTRPISVDARFARLGGTARMVITAPNTTETIRWIQFSTTEANLAGSYQLNPETGEMSPEMLAGEKTLVLHPATATTYSGNVVVWFRVAAVTLSQDFSITVQTDGKKYTKTIDLAAASRQLRFVNGRLSTFTLDMSAVTGTAAPVDVIDKAFTEVSGQSYTLFGPKGDKSDALYKGYASRANAQATTFRIKKEAVDGQHSGFVSTQTGGYVKQVVVKLPIHDSDRVLDIYVNNNAYSDPNDMWSQTNSVKGTKLYSVNTSQTEEVIQVINFTSNYQYIGFRSNNNTIDISQIQIAWQTGKMPTATVTTGAASEIISSRATLSASFAGASGVIYETGFFWDTDQAALEAHSHPNQVITTDGSNESSGDFSCTLGSLNESTTYYYKAYVLEYDEDNLQYVERYGSIQEFETLPKANYVPSGWLELPSYDENDMAGTTTSTLTNLYPVTHSAMMGNPATLQRNYTLLYDPEMYASYWVAYPLSNDYLSTGRTDSWAFDPDVPEFLQTNLTNGAYGVNVVSAAYPKEQYYARGHQIPNADRNGWPEMQAQTYYMTNVTPQLQNGFNAHIWGDLEEAVRNLVKGNSKTVYVVTGAAFRKKGGSEEIKTITNNRDGKTIPVPNYYWKVVLKVTWDQETIVGAKTIGFWLEHRDDLKVTLHKTYDDFVTSVDQIEAWTGFDFFTNIGDLQTAAESNTDWNAFKNY